MFLSICGGVLTLFVATALCTKPGKHRSERWLAILLFYLAFDLFLHGYRAGALYRSFPHLLGFDRSLPFLYGPFLYLLSLSVTGHLSFGPRHLLHFGPFLIHLAFLVPFHLKNGATKIFLEENFIPGIASIEPAPRLFFLLKTASLLGYLIAAFAVTARYERLIREFFSEVSHYQLTGLRMLLFVAAIQLLSLFGAGATYFVIQPAFVRPDLPTGYYVGHILLAAFIGIQLIRTPDLWRNLPDIERLLEPDLAVSVPAEEADKYAKTRIEPALAAEYRDRLVAHMEKERPFKDPLLTLPQLAKQIGIAPHHLSQVINGLLGMNFYTFVNRHRIEYAKKLLAEGAENILAVAYECGFNAKSAFNTHFRKYTGMTPSEFRKANSPRS